jgi:hypothetical protein
MMDQRTKARISAEETARFIDSQFGQLDLSGSPDLSHPLADTFELQDRHGLNRVDDAGLAVINQLKELLSNPPREVMEELAKETNNPELISELAHERAEEVAHEFRRRNPGYLKCNANWRSMIETLAHNYLGEDDLDALRANISETLPVVVINEQGEEEKNKDEALPAASHPDPEEFSWCCLRGRGWRRRFLSGISFF